jgi:hypothetical protein
VQRGEDDRPVEAGGFVTQVENLRAGVPGKPVIPLAKVCWAGATKNDTGDVVRTIEALTGAKLGFVLWYYGWIFRPEDDRYDPEAVVRALGGDPASLPAREEPSPAQQDGRLWVYFDSRETANGPRLEVGRKEVAASADSLLISYIAGRAFGVHRQLSISLADTNRVLLAFPAGALRARGKAVLRLTMHKSQIPPTAPFELAVHRVLEPWSEAETSWSRQPSFEEEPITTVTVDPERQELEIDVTEWTRSGKTEHGLLLKAAKPVPVLTGPTRRTTGPWTQPEIRTGTPFSDTIPWAEDLETALATAKETGKPVLVTVVPVGDRRWVSGYRGAERVRKGQEPHPWGDERAMAIDSGLVKERAMMASLFTDPEIVHLVKACFVPVRLRLHTYVFDEAGSRQFEDPLATLGTSGREVGGPALVFARPDGRPLHACRRMGVFSVPMVREMLRAVLRKAGAARPPAFPDERPAALRRAWEQAREGNLPEARRILDRLKQLPEGAAWRWEAIYLRGHLLDKLGEPKGARECWAEAARGDPKGPWGSKAAVRLREREGRLDEWETLTRFPFDPLAERTEVGPGDEKVEEVLEHAADYLLLQQRPDGGWHDPFVDVHPMAGPGSAYDKSVPRTGLVVDALLGLREVLPKRREELTAAAARGIDFVGRFADAPAPHVWKLTYALHLQVAILGADLPKKAKEAARTRAMKLVATLRSVQHQGGWSYMPPPRIHSFNTAPVLLMLAELRDLGVEVPGPVADQAARFLEGLREESDPREFAYASNVRHRALRSSSCRTALCELALLRHAKGKDVTRLRAGVELFFEFEEPVRRTTKVFEAYFALTSLHDAYHYYFGHYYTARALARLPREEAAKFAKRQMECVLAQRELDGSFVDAQMQGKCTSTAMAVLTLLEDLSHRR